MNVYGLTKGAKLRQCSLYTALTAVLFVVGPVNFSYAAENTLAKNRHCPSCERVRINIASQRADLALVKLAQETGIQLIFVNAQVRGTRTRRVRGENSPRKALRKMLRGTDLRYSFTGPKTVTITKRDDPVIRAQRIQKSAKKKARQVAGADLSPVVQDSPGLFYDGMEELLVTGSRILRSSGVGPVPMTIYGKQSIQYSGQTELSDMILDMPSVSSEFNIQNTQLSTQVAGLSVVEHRNLGANRTLVLIDGMRTVSNASEANWVSLSTIPDAIIQRVEVSTGGASAVYGSDAVAGVVNIITFDHYEGLTVNGSVGVAGEGGGEDLKLSAIYGFNFAGDKGNILFTATADLKRGIDASERDFATVSAEFDRSNNILVTPDPSEATPGGTFERGNFYFDDNGLQTDFIVAEHGYEFRPLNTLSIPRDRYLGGLKVRYELSPDTEFFLHAQYAHLETSSRRAPDAANSRFLGEIPLDNPFIPSLILDDVNARGRTGVRFKKRLLELGNRTRQTSRDVYRFWSGMDGRFNDNWTWAGHVGWNRFEQQQSRENDLNIAHFQAALDVEADPDRAGRFRCKNVEARAEGCVPLNLFGTFSVSALARDYIQHDDSYQVKLEQLTAVGHVSGTLMPLPYGELRVVIGAEYRKESLDVEAGSVLQAGNSSLAFLPTFDGSFNVLEGFAEARVPLLADVRFVREFTLDGAFRMAKYSQTNVGTAISFRVGLTWEPVESLLLRSRFSRALRAPDISELFSPARGNFEFVDDPCDRITSSSTGRLAQNCFATPEVAAAIALNGEFIQAPGSVFSPERGNDQLKEEVSDTITVGAIWTPEDFYGLSISLDYFDIDVAGVITSLDVQNQLDDCYLSLGDFERKPQCRLISRDDDGQISLIDKRQENLSSLRTRGIDLGVGFGFDLEDTVGVPGDFTFDFLSTYVLDLEEVRFGLDGVVIDRLDGEVGDNKFQARATLGWRYNTFYLRWRTAYLDAVIDSYDRQEFFNSRGISDPLFLNFGDEWTHHFYIRYEPVGLSRLAYFAGVNNIFNNYGPFLPSGTVSGNSSNFNSRYGSEGRYIYGGITLNY